VTYINTAGVITVGIPSTTTEADYLDNSCRPNLNQAWLTSLNSDKVVTPDALHIPAGTGAIGSGTYDAAPYLYWIHRHAGSGTQAGFNATFANTPWAPSVAQVTSPFAAGAGRLNTAGYACGSTGDLPKFLSTGTPPATCTSGTANETPAATTPVPASAFSVGILDLNSAPIKTVGGAHTGDDGYQFVKVFRADPENYDDAVKNAAVLTTGPANTAADIADGLYPYFFSGCFNTTTSAAASACDPTLRANLYADFASASTQSLLCGTAPNVTPAAGSTLSSNGIFCTPESAACTAATPAARCLNITRDQTSGEPIRIYK
jgi:hypothetical protein